LIIENEVVSVPVDNVYPRCTSHPASTAEASIRGHLPTALGSWCYDVGVDVTTARRAERVLRSMLKAEFGIQAALPCDANAALYLAKVANSIG
jgi:hypothetical protein